MSDSEIAVDFSPFLHINKDGSVKRLLETQRVPPFDPNNHVLSKDVVYSPEHNLSARLYLPNQSNSVKKLPLLVYFHGGGFCIGSAFSPTYHTFHISLVSAAQVAVVSVEYRLAPEHHLPKAYEDSWAAVKWVASHVNGNGPEEWLNVHADLGNVFLAGDSAGANITHHMALRHREEKEELLGVELKGFALIHPYFWGKDCIGNESRDPQTKALIEKLWHFSHPTTSGLDDPLINPFVDSKFSCLGSVRVLIFVAGKDLLRDRGLLYYEELKKSGWGGTVEIVDTEGEDHCFHLFIPGSENSKALLGKFATFLTQDGH